MIENIMITFVKNLFMNLCIARAYLGINGIYKYNKITIIMVEIIVSTLYAFIYEIFKLSAISIYANFIFYIIVLLIISNFVDFNYKKFIVSMLISMSFSFASFFLACSIQFVLLQIPIFQNRISNLLEFIFIGILQLMFMILFFKIKRFKNGFSFINESNISKELLIILDFIVGVFIIFVISKEKWLDDLTYLVIVLGTCFIIFLIQRSITNHYKSKMKDRTVEYLNEQIKEKDKIIENLKTDLDKTLKINHKYNHRISAMERAIVKAKFKEEFAEENNEIINLVKELAKDYKSETFEAESNLPKTNVFSIDNILEYMANKAKNDNIEFQVDVKCNIKDLITNIVKQSKLATLLADHINDAIIAINYSENELRKILVVFDKIDEIYEIKIYDTGIKFEIETLLKLGKEQVTTHKDSGGTGIGFMTTFETLKESKGSLIIEEDNSENYSKAIIIKFDNKCGYKIRSYRADEIREQNKNSSIIIEKI